ncbi:hypothetical protein AnigIFM50267_011418 [Aspergillus niger]|nr:hypothetical protein AnigIFM50267_011418 [Aspergillus niger]
MSDNTPTPNIPSEEPVVTNVTIDYQGLNHGDEGVSENATRSIFGWLRVEGFPPNEKKIHDWIYIDESDYEGSTDEDSEKSKDSGEKHVALKMGVEQWIEHNAGMIN